MFRTIIAEIWNKSHIVRELFQTPFFFPLYKALHGTFLKDIEISLEKYNIH